MNSIRSYPLTTLNVESDFTQQQQYHNHHHYDHSLNPTIDDDTTGIVVVATVPATVFCLSWFVAGVNHFAQLHNKLCKDNGEGELLPNLISAEVEVIVVLTFCVVGYNGNTFSNNSDDGGFLEQPVVSAVAVVVLFLSKFYSIQNKSEEELFR